MDTNIKFNIYSISTAKIVNKSVSFRIIFNILNKSTNNYIILYGALSFYSSFDYIIKLPNYESHIGVNANYIVKKKYAKSLFSEPMLFRTIITFDDETELYSYLGISGIYDIVKQMVPNYKVGKKVYTAPMYYSLLNAVKEVDENYMIRVETTLPAISTNQWIITRE